MAKARVRHYIGGGPMYYVDGKKGMRAVTNAPGGKLVAELSPHGVLYKRPRRWCIVGEHSYRNHPGPGWAICRKAWAWARAQGAHTFVVNTKEGDWSISAKRFEEVRVRLHDDSTEPQWLVNFEFWTKPPAQGTML